MLTSKFFTRASALVLTVLSFTACDDEQSTPDAQTGEITLRLDNGVSVTTAANVTTFNRLVLDAATYKNANGDDFTVSTFKYYISNVKLLKADKSAYAVPESYFLVDHAKPDSRDLTMKDVPAGEYTALTFTVGVDSARTESGLFTGVLNANNGMFWDMNGPEFINLKLEGRSPQSPTTGLVFHLAGYKSAATNTIRTVTLPFGASKLVVGPSRKPTVQLRADIAKLFTGPNPATTANPPFLNPVSFATVYNKMGGPAASKLADNVATGMFSVTSIDTN